MSRSRLRRFLSPRSIAAVGGRWARAAARQCRAGGSGGDIWVVNSRLAGAEGLPCFADVADLPQAPDAAFVAVNRDETIAVVAALAARGCGGVVCFASGFEESGDDDAQRRLLAAAGDMPLLGPNCYGYLNYLDGALLWPDQHGGERVDRGAAIISQSGNMAISLTMQRRGLPLAFVCAVGNQARLGFAALTRALAEDSRVTVIGWLMEGADDAAALERTLRDLRGKKPVVALKLGATAGGAAAALTHTASLSGDDAAADAFFWRHGVARARSLPAFLETLKLAHFCGPLRGRNIVSLSCSGGEAALIADRLALRRLHPRPFSAAEGARIRDVMGDWAAAQNPYDYHTFVWGDAAKMRAAYRAVLDCDYDLSLLTLDFPRRDRCDGADFRLALDAYCDAAAAANTAGAKAVAATLPENLPEDVVAAAAARGVCCLAGAEEALDAAMLAADIGERWRAPAAPPLCRANHRAGGAARALDEAAGKKALAAAGIVVPAGGAVGDADEAAAVAADIGFPVAVKALGIAHKSDVGGVCLGLQDAAAVRRAVADMRDLSRRFLTEKMIDDVVAELLVGVRYDELGGLTMTIAAGGAWTETLRDAATVLLPTDAAAVREALASLRAAPMWQGGRGAAKTDEAAATRSILAIAAFAERHVDTLAELEINPLLLRASGAPAAADALLSFVGDGDDGGGRPIVVK